MAGWSMAGWSDGVATAFKQVEGGYLLQLNPSVDRRGVPTPIGELSY
jgi:hypothetical protein